jgi:hypothetical protein
MYDKGVRSLDVKMTPVQFRMNLNSNLFGDAFYGLDHRPLITRSWIILLRQLVDVVPSCLMFERQRIRWTVYEGVASYHFNVIVEASCCGQGGIRCGCPTFAALFEESNSLG